MRTIIPNNANLVPNDATKVFSGNIFDVYQWKQKMFDDSYETFEMLKRCDTTKVFCIVDDKVIILNEEQPGFRPFVDIPGGRHDNQDETELQAAQREVLEETGYSFDSWKLVSIQQPGMKIDWFVYLFVACDGKKTQEPTAEPGEKIKINFCDLTEAKSLLSSPQNRNYPDILDQVNNIDDLKNLQEFKGKLI